MRLTKTLVAAAALAVSASAVNAGGLAPAVTEKPVVIVDSGKSVVEKATGSINPGLIVLGLTAALVAASASF